MAPKTSIIVAAAFAFVGIGLLAQRPLAPAPLEPEPRPALGHETAVRVLSGENVGVQVFGEPDTSGKIPGTLVVKIRGQWVEVTGTPPTVSTR
jgi:hypothetical protein